MQSYNVSSYSSCTQVHELLQYHYSGTREGTLYTYAYKNIYFYNVKTTMWRKNVM